MLIVGLALLVSAAPIRRATWAVYGVFGFYAAVVHYLTQGLDQDRWPFALLLLFLGLSLFALRDAHAPLRQGLGTTVRAASTANPQCLNVSTRHERVDRSVQTGRAAEPRALVPAPQAVPQRNIPCSSQAPPSRVSTSPVT